jgi:DNA-binding transcriptional ArsR family regulator
MSPIEELLIDKKTQIERIIQKVKGLIGIEKETGDVNILISLGDLSDKEKIGLFFIGKYLAFEGKLISNPTVTRNELAEKFGLDKDAISARLSELKKEGIIKSTKKSMYDININKMDNILNQIKKRDKK